MGRIWTDFPDPVKCTAKKCCAECQWSGSAVGSTGFREDNCSCNPAWLYDLLQRNWSGKNPDCYLYGGSNERYVPAVCRILWRGTGWPTGVQNDQRVMCKDHQLLWKNDREEAFWTGTGWENNGRDAVHDLSTEWTCICNGKWPEDGAYSDYLYQEYDADWGRNPWTRWRSWSEDFRYL